MLKAFSHCMLYASDLHRAVECYCGKLGFTERFIAGDEFASLWHPHLELRLDIHALPGHQGSDMAGPIPYFLCDDILATRDELRAAGLVVSDPRREGDSPWFSTFLDSEGNVLGIEQVRDS